VGRALLQRPHGSFDAVRQRPSDDRLAIRAGCCRACGGGGARPSSARSPARR
jgi:hypothetical protein